MESKTHSLEIKLSEKQLERVTFVKIKLIHNKNGISRLIMGFKNDLLGDEWETREDFVSDGDFITDRFVREFIDRPKLLTFKQHKQVAEWAHKILNQLE